VAQNANEAGGRQASRPSWTMYQGHGMPPEPGELILLPDPPPWRDFDPSSHEDTTFARKLGHPAPGSPRTASRRELDMVNAAITLRRPLIVTGPPGAGKSSLAYRIARELGLGRVLSWPVNSHSTLRSGLYEYDAIGRMQAAASRYPLHDRAADAAPWQAPESDLGDFLRLGPIGTALLPREQPRVLLIDELDKSDVDLPDNLLNVFEEGRFEITELMRIRQRHPEVTCTRTTRARARSSKAALCSAAHSRSSSSPATASASSPRRFCAAAFNSRYRRPTPRTCCS